MSGHDLLKEAACLRTLDEPLPKLSLLKNNKPVVSGSGRLHYDDRKRLVLRVYTDSIVPEDGHGVGKLLYPDERLSTEGETLRGFRLQATGLMRGGGSGYSPGFAESVFTTHEFGLHTEFPIDGYSAEMDGYINSGVEFPTNHKSARTDSSPMMRWLEIEVAGARIDLREENEKVARLRVQTKETNTQKAIALSEAFLNALSFRMGERHRWLVFTIRGERKETTIIRCPSEHEGGWYPPLPRFLPLPEQEQAETDFLQKATAYLADGSHEAVANILDVCALASQTNFPAESLLIGSALEGLADYVLDAHSISPPANDVAEFETLKQAAISALRTDTSVHTDPLFARLASRIGSASLRPSNGHPNAYKQLKRRAKAVLRSNTRTSGHRLLNHVLKHIGKDPFDHHRIVRAAGFLQLTVSDREFTDWESIRHPRAHGDFTVNAADRGSLQTEADQQSCVANLINKFVLALIGYSGPYVDYSSPNYPTSHFP